MKKFLKGLILTFCFAAVSFGAKAALSTTIRWNIPGALKVYVGGSGESYRVNLPEGATEYVATIDNSWGSTYLAKANGYEIESVIADGTALNPMYNGMYNIDMSRYNGKVVEVTLEKVEYDRTISVNVINGRDALTATMWGTGREIDLSTGEQQIAYSSKYEEGIDIEALVEGSENPYIKQNGVEKEWKAYNPWDNYLYHLYDDATNKKGFGFDEGTDFEIKYCETEDTPDAEPSVITLSYQNEMARDALTFIFNVSRMQTITERESFSVKAGDIIRLVFNTKDYTVTVDENTVTPTGDITPYEFTVTEDRTISISAVIREYGEVAVTLAVSDIDGVRLNKGSYEGETIGVDELTVLGTKSYTYKDPNDNSKTAELTIYQTMVSEKSPKIFVTEKPGYWFETCEYKDGGDVVWAGIATPDYELNVVATPIVADTKLVIYISVDNLNAVVSDVAVRDRNHKTYSLTAGYNEFVVDDAYCSPISVSGIGIGEGTSFAVFNNMESVAKDGESGAFNCKLDGESVIHIFAGRPVPAKCTISAEISEMAEGAEVMVDRLHRLGAGTSEQQTFKTCEVEVNPAGFKYMLDGEVPEYEGATHLFKASKDHQISISGDSGVDTPQIEQTGESEAAEYYNMQGIRIEKPLKGELTIEKRGSKTVKRICKNR